MQGTYTCQEMAITDVPYIHFKKGRHWRETLDDLGRNRTFSDLSLSAIAENVSIPLPLSHWHLTLHPHQYWHSHRRLSALHQHPQALHLLHQTSPQSP